MADVEVSWTIPTPGAGESAIDHFEVEYSDDGATTWNVGNPAVPAGDSSVVLSDVPNGLLTVSVQSVDADGDKSARVTATLTAADIVPPAPTGVAAQNV